MTWGHRDGYKTPAPWSRAKKLTYSLIPESGMSLLGWVCGGPEPSGGKVRCICPSVGGETPVPKPGRLYRVLGKTTRDGPQGGALHKRIPVQSRLHPPNVIFLISSPFTNNSMNKINLKLSWAFFPFCAFPVFAV